MTPDLKQQLEAHGYVVPEHDQPEWVLGLLPLRIKNPDGHEGEDTLWISIDPRNGEWFVGYGAQQDCDPCAYGDSLETAAAKLLLNLIEEGIVKV